MVQDSYGDGVLIARNDHDFSVVVVTTSLQKTVFLFVSECTKTKAPPAEEARLCMYTFKLRYRGGVEEDVDSIV